MAVSEQLQTPVYSAAINKSKLVEFRGRVLSSLCLAAGNLALDLFSEFERVRDFLKDFGSAAGAANYDRSEAEDSPQRRLFDSDAFNSRQEKFDGAAAREAGLDDYSLVGKHHYGGAALDEANSKKNRSDEERGEGEPDQNIRMRVGAVPDIPGEYEKSGTRQDEKCREAGVAEHDDPMQLGLILDRFTGDEMFVSVAQRGSSRGCDAIHFGEYCDEL
jgi:hypothetical protein